MRTMWIGGKSSNLRPGGVTRLGPANPTGLARSDQCGSVRTLTPSSWTRSVEWPTHVNVSAPGLDRMALKSLATRSEEHTSELQSQSNIVCRLLLEKIKNLTPRFTIATYQHVLPGMP